MQSGANEANPLANLKQELALNHSMVMDQLSRVQRELKKLKPSLEDHQQSSQRRTDRLKEELVDEMVKLTGRQAEMERTLQERLEQLYSQLQEKLLKGLQTQTQTQQETLDQLATKLESFSRQTTASLSQLRLALTMSEIEADLRQRQRPHDDTTPGSGPKVIKGPQDRPSKSGE